MHGSHLLSHWARTQQGVALSSAEAELNAAIKAGCESLGVRHMVQEMGKDLGVRVLGDSSAVKGIVSRKGVGRVKHLHTRQLWLQEQIQQKEMAFEKIPRAIISADALTHHYTKAEGMKHFTRMSLI